jgi:hypothetical protein
MKAIQEEMAWDPDPVWVSGLAVIRNSSGEAIVFTRTRNTEWQCYPDWV